MRSDQKITSRSAAFAAAAVLAFTISGLASAPVARAASAAPAAAATQPAATQPAAATAPAAGSPAVSATAAGPAFVCTAPAEFARFTYPLRHTARRLAAGEPLTIVAIGSSSTSGAGASSRAASYPSRLAIELKERFPAEDITVLNRGVNGEEAADMLARFEQSVAAAHPDVVLWQVGTNAVLRDNPLGPVDQLVHDGIARIKAIGADVVLIDPQFAPKVIAKSDAEEMVDLVSAAARQAGVDLFPRFAVMRVWHDKEAMPFEAFLSPDLLHMNDWSYGCLAKLLSSTIVEAATRPFASARARP